MNTQTHSPLPPIRNLECAVCANYAYGRQWYNRDTGYGICKSCADFIETKYGLFELNDCYGQRGVHFDIPARELLEKVKP